MFLEPFCAQVDAIKSAAACSAQRREALVQNGGWRAAPDLLPLPDSWIYAEREGGMQSSEFYHHIVSAMVIRCGCSFSI